MRLDSDSDEYFNFIANNPPQTDPFEEIADLMFLEQVYEEPHDPNDTLEQFKDKIKQKRELIHLYNIQQYPYARAHNYHFFLDSFERIEGQRTYALDYDNRFRATFRKEDTLYKNDRLGDIVNRVAFTCPLRTTQDNTFVNRKDGRSKNQAHSYLFSVEDEKYATDRQLTTLRLVFSRLHLLSVQKLKSFQILTKNPALRFLLDPTLPLDDKRTKLENMIDNLDRLKKFKTNNWVISDYFYFYSSIQQKLHDRVERDKYFQDRSDIFVKTVNRFNRLTDKVQLSPTNEEFQYNANKLLVFFPSHSPCISEQKLQEMGSNWQTIKTQKEIFPLALFYLGSQNFRQKVNHFMMSVVRKNDNEMEENVAMTINRLFRESCQAKDTQEIMSLQESKEKAMRKIEEVKEAQLQRANSPKHSTLDKYLNLQSLNDQSGQWPYPLLLLKGHKMIINQSQVRLLLFYSKLCQILCKLEPALTQNDQLIQILTSPHFSHLVHGFIGHLHNCLISKAKFYIKNIVKESLLSMVSTRKVQQQEEGGKELQFEFNTQTGLGVVWEVEKGKKTTQKKGKDLSFFKKMAFYQSEDQIMQSLQEEEEEDLSNIQNYPFQKRVKEDQN